MGQTDRGDGRGGVELQEGWEGLLGCSQPGAWAPGPGGATPPRRHGRLPESGDLIAKHLKHKGRELHAAVRLEGERAILLGVFLVEAT